MKPIGKEIGFQKISKFNYISIACLISCLSQYRVDYEIKTWPILVSIADDALIKKHILNTKCNLAILQSVIYKFIASYQDGIFSYIKTVYQYLKIHYKIYIIYWTEDLRANVFKTNCADNCVFQDFLFQQIWNLRHVLKYPSQSAPQTIL